VLLFAIYLPVVHNNGACVVGAVVVGAAVVALIVVGVWVVGAAVVALIVVGGWVVGAAVVGHNCVLHATAVDGWIVELHNAEITVVLLIGSLQLILNDCTPPPHETLQLDVDTEFHWHCCVLQLDVDEGRVDKHIVLFTVVVVFGSMHVMLWFNNPPPHNWLHVDDSNTSCHWHACVLHAVVVAGCVDKHMLLVTTVVVFGSMHVTL
jgi:hypothetical protein